MRIRALPRALLFLPLLLLLAAVPTAQTVFTVLEWAALGYPGATVSLIEADGNPATVEVLAIRHSDQLYSVGSWRTTLCRGAWFSPWANAGTTPFLSPVSVQRFGGRDYLFVQPYGTPQTVVLTLTPPPCS